MCLTMMETTRDKARTLKKNPLTATKNIKVFKVVEKWRDGSYHSPYMSNFTWEEGKTYTSKIKGAIEKGGPGEWYIHIDEGLHATTNPVKCSNVAAYAGRDRRVVEMIIPKDAKYFANERGEIVADTMRFPKGAKIYTTLQFKKAHKL